MEKAALRSEERCTKQTLHPMICNYVGQATLNDLIYQDSAVSHFDNHPLSYRMTSIGDNARRHLAEL